MSDADTPRTLARWRQEWVDHNTSNGRSSPSHGMCDFAEDLERENAKLRSFAAAALKDWPGYMGLDGFDLQDLAVEHGLLAAKDPKPTEPCVKDPCAEHEECRCAEYYSAADWKDGVVCYQRTPLLVGHNV